VCPGTQRRRGGRCNRHIFPERVDARWRHLLNVVTYRYTHFNTTTQQSGLRWPKEIVRPHGPLGRHVCVKVNYQVDADLDLFGLDSSNHAQQVKAFF